VSLIHLNCFSLATRCFFSAKIFLKLVLLTIIMRPASSTLPVCSACSFIPPFFRQWQRFRMKYLSNYSNEMTSLTALSLTNYPYIVVFVCVCSIYRNADTVVCWLLYFYPHFSYNLVMIKVGKFIFNRSCWYITGHHCVRINRGILVYKVSYRWIMMFYMLSERMLTLTAVYLQRLAALPLSMRASGQ
jgi:hypothetical protein